VEGGSVRLAAVWMEVALGAFQAANGRIWFW
jgi:hypothetical protein